jgi:hypothetical protein
MIARRSLLLALCAAAFAGAASAVELIEVYKSESCGCCAKWIEHLRAHGFEVRARDVAEPSLYRAKFGVPERLGSCHTATVAGYALEGHVPAREIKRLLAERPKAQGLAVPGMPLGSPGMEGPRNDPYEVLLFRKDGRTSTYARYGR